VQDRAEPAVQEVDGSTMAAAWLPVAELRAGRHEVVDLVRLGLALAP
jgi:hypothetical protein